MRHPPAVAGPRRAAHLVTLWAFAVAQPLYDLVGRNATFLVAHRLGRFELWLLVFVLSFLLPGAILAVVAILIRLPPRQIGFVVLEVCTGSLAALLVAQVLKKSPVQIPVVVFLLFSLIAGGLFAFAVRRFEFVRRVLDLAVVAVFVFPSLFLMRPEIDRSIPRAPAREPLQPDSKYGIPVVLLVFDELSLPSLLDGTGAIDASRFPNFATLARGSNWYRSATTVAWNTELAVPALLTGQYPNPESLPTASDHPDSLFTLLASTYSLNVHESITALCQLPQCEGDRRDRLESFLVLAGDLGVVLAHIVTPRELEAALPDTRGAWSGFARRSRSGFEAARRSRPFDGALEIQSNAQGDSKPMFNFLHIMLPHLPYRRLPSGREYGPSAASFFPHGLAAGEIWATDEWPSLQAHQRYLLQLGYTDRVLGELLERLRSLDLYDRSLVVVVADHGVSFRPGESRRYVTDANADWVLPVPLFVKLPNQHSGLVNDRPARIIDVVPTVADIVGVNVPWRLDGESLLRSESVRSVAKVFASPQKGWRECCEPLDLAQASAMQRLRFGQGGGYSGVYRIGDCQSLLDKAIDTAAVPKAAGVGVELDEVSQYSAVRLDGDFVPANLSGRLVGARAAEVRRLAISLNGSVGAVTQPYSEGGDLRFQAIVDEARFLQGRNSVEVFEVVESSRERCALMLVGAARNSGENLRLDFQGAGRERLVTASGREYEIQDVSKGRGLVERLSWSRGFLDVAGWAGEPDSGEPASGIVVVNAGQVIYWGPSDSEREDVAVATGRRSLMRSGFDLHLPVQERVEQGAIRVFAFFKSGSANELRRELGRPRGAATAIESCDGQRVEVVPGAIEAHLEWLEYANGFLRIQGWAGDRRSGLPAAAILVTRGERCMFVRAPDLDRPDVVAETGKSSLRKTGFKWIVPASEIARIESGLFRLYAISRGGVATEFIPAEGFNEISGSAGDSFSVIVGCKGDRYPVERDEVQGHVDRLLRMPQAAMVRGWAANWDAGLPADHIVVLQGDRCVFQGAPSVDRPDLVQSARHASIRKSGFRIIVGLGQDRQQAASPFRVFGVSRSGIASELTKAAGFDLPPNETDEVRGDAVDCDGIKLLQDNAELIGFVDRVEADVRSLTIDGWAASRQGDRLPAEIRVLNGGHCLRTSRTLVERPDVARLLGGPQEMRWGFTLKVRPFEESPSRGSELRILAISSRGIATEIWHGKLPRRSSH